MLDRDGGVRSRQEVEMNADAEDGDGVMEREGKRLGERLRWKDAMDRRRE